MDSKLHKKTLSLSYFTVGYNILEGIVSIFAGLLAGSIALVGFGLDSFRTETIIVMPVLFYMKYQTGKSINSRSLVADSKQTLVCVFLSIALLIGLGMNYLYGFWEADPLVGLIIVILLIKEGYYTLKEEKLCNC